MADKNEDDQWLAALRGQTTDELSKTEREAVMIRNAVVQDTQSRPAYKTSDLGLQRLMAAAQQQKLLRPEKLQSTPQRWLNAAYEFLAAPASVMASLALVVGLSVTASWQAEQLHGLETDTVRGGAIAEQINLIVPSSQAAAALWQKALLDAQVAHTVSFETPTRILVRMKLTPAAIELLGSKRIQPPVGEWCTLVIESEKVKP